MALCPPVGVMQGLQTMWKFEKEWAGRPDLHLTQAALETCAACIDTFGRCMANNTALTKQMAVLEPISDHAFTLPVRLLHRLSCASFICLRLKH